MTGMRHQDLPRELEAIGHAVIGAAMEVHTALGPGLIETVYEAALVHELGLRGIRSERQVPVCVRYKDLEIRGQRLDLLVDGRVIIELKAVESLHPVHTGQLLSYLRCSGLQLGLLINFSTSHLRDGIRRVINQIPGSPSRPSRPPEPSRQFKEGRVHA